MIIFLSNFDVVLTIIASLLISCEFHQVISAAPDALVDGNSATYEVCHIGRIKCGNLETPTMIRYTNYTSFSFDNSDILNKNQQDCDKECKTQTNCLGFRHYSKTFGAAIIQYCILIKTVIQFDRTILDCAPNDEVHILGCCPEWDHGITRKRTSSKPSTKLAVKIKTEPSKIEKLLVTSKMNFGYLIRTVTDEQKGVIRIIHNNNDKLQSSAEAKSSKMKLWMILLLVGIGVCLIAISAVVIYLLSKKKKPIKQQSEYFLGDKKGASFHGSTEQ